MPYVFDDSRINKFGAEKYKSKLSRKDKEQKTLKMTTNINGNIWDFDICANAECRVRCSGSTGRRCLCTAVGVDSTEVYG